MPETKVSTLATHAPDSITRGMEIAGTVLAFLLIGWFIDRRLGSTPWFMIVLVVLALVAQFLKLFYVYNAQMSRLESQRREAVHAQ
jgi:F0F1-type ATP synthase assembly protein I